MRVVVTGATGYVGSRLVPELLGRGHEVVATSSARLRPERFSWGADVEWAPMDAREPDQARAALRGADAACYLVHSLSSRSFAVADAVAAGVVREAAEREGVARMVYLSGLVPPVPREQLSEHIRSRLEVEEILAGSPSSTLALRAGVVLGAGSTSFEIVRQVCAVTPVQVVPPWMRSRVQPVSVADVLQYLADAVERPDVTGHLDVGAGDVLSYAELMATYAREAGLLRVQLPAPPTPIGVASALAPLATAAPWWTVAALVRSLRHDMVCEPGRRDPLRGDAEPVGVAEAIRRSLRPPAFPGEATTYGGDPHVAAGSDPGWTRGWPQVVEPGGPAADLAGIVGGAAHVAEYRLRGLLGL